VGGVPIGSPTAAGGGLVGRKATQSPSLLVSKQALLAPSAPQILPGAASRGRRATGWLPCPHCPRPPCSSPDGRSTKYSRSRGAARDPLRPDPRPQSPRLAGDPLDAPPLTRSRLTSTLHPQWPHDTEATLPSSLLGPPWAPSATASTCAPHTLHPGTPLPLPFPSLASASALPLARSPLALYTASAPRPGTRARTEYPVLTIGGGMRRELESGSGLCCPP